MREHKIPYVWIEFKNKQSVLFKNFYIGYDNRAIGTMQLVGGYEDIFSAVTFFYPFTDIVQVIQFHQDIIVEIDENSLVYEIIEGKLAISKYHEQTIN